MEILCDLPSTWTGRSPSLKSLYNRSPNDTSTLSLLVLAAVSFHCPVMDSPRPEPHPYTSPAVAPAERTASLRKTNSSTGSIDEKAAARDPEVVLTQDVDQEEEKKPSIYQRFRPFILAGVAAVILGWWVSSIVLKATRHRW